MIMLSSKSGGNYLSSAPPSSLLPPPPPPRLSVSLSKLGQHDPKSTPSKWCLGLCNFYVYDAKLTLSGIVISKGEVLTQYIELVTKCLRFVSVMGRRRWQLWKSVFSYSLFIVYRWHHT